MAVQSLSFDGSNDYVGCGNVPTSGLAALTVEAYVKFDVISGNRGIVTKNGSTAQDWTLYLDSSGRLAFWIKNNSGVAQTALYTAGLATGTWYHVAGVFNGSVVRVFVNGVAGVTAPALTGTVTTSTQAVEMGRNSEVEWLDGNIGWARISNTARYTAAFTPPAMLPKKDSNVLAQWNFTEDRGTVLDNITGTATYDGTINGATWSTATPWPGTILDTLHVFELHVDGTDYWSNVVKKSLRLKDGVDSQVPSLDFVIEETGVAGSLSFGGWKEAQFRIDGQLVFGGYVTKARPVYNRSDRLSWEVQCEGWITIFNRSTLFQKTYTRKTPGYILADLFTQAGLTGYDVTTYVTAGTALDHFYHSKEEKLTDAIDRLVLLAGGGDWVWNVDAEKRVWMGLPSVRTSPFALASTASATYSTTFPILKQPTKDIDEADIRNRITVVGGTTPSSPITDQFNGDGSTLIFTLTQSPIYDVIRVVVGGVIHPHGVDWVHSFGGAYRCLVNYVTGTVRWDTGDAPPAGTNNIQVVYRRADDVQVVVSSAPSYALYGRYFDYELADGGITTAAEATTIANALLALYAMPNVVGTAVVERWGVEVGQRLTVEFSPMFTGEYTVREVVVEVTDPWSVRCSLKFGGKLPKASAISDPVATGHGSLTGTRTTGSTGGTGTSGGGGPVLGGGGGAPPIDGEINIVRLNNRIEAIDRATDYDPTTYGNATGIVIEYDPDTQAGRILGLNNGVLQGYIDSDGGIKGGGNTVIIYDGGIAIVSPNGTPSVNEKYRFASADLVDTYGALYAFRGLNTTNMVLGVDGAAEDDLANLELRADAPTTRGTTVLIEANTNGTSASVTVSANDDLVGSPVSQVIVVGDTDITGGVVASKGATINESGVDSDTRIEGNNDADLVFVDAGNDRVGIGTNAPASKLQVIGETRLGGASHYLKVDTSGQLSLVGDATQFVEVWLPATAMYQSGATPDWYKAIGNLFFAAFGPDTDEELHGSLLIPANYKDGSNITVGIRWLAIGDGEGGEQVRWGLEYAWCDKNEVLAAASGDIGVTAPASPLIVAHKHYDTQFSAITGTNMLGGSTFAFRLYRDANHADDDWVDDVYLVGLYIRYEIDKLGANS